MTIALTTTATTAAITAITAELSDGQKRACFMQALFFVSSVFLCHNRQYAGAAAELSLLCLRTRSR